MVYKFGQDLKNLLGFGGKVGLFENQDSFFQRNIKADSFTKYSAHVKDLPEFNSTGEFFTKATTGRAKVLNQIKSALDSHDTLRESIDDSMQVIGENGGKGSPELERMLRRKGSDVAKNANKLRTISTKLVEKHQKGIALATEAASKSEAELVVEFNKAFEKFQTQPVNARGSRFNFNGADFNFNSEAAKEEAISKLTENFNAAKSRIRSVMDDAITKHSDTITELKSLNSEVESTMSKLGIKPTAIESTVAKSGEEAFVKTETHAAPAAGNPLKTGALIGGGALLGYMVGNAIDDEEGFTMKKGATTVGGGVLGWIIDKVFMSPNTHIPSTAGYSQLAQRMEQGVERAAAHGMPI